MNLYVRVLIFVLLITSMSSYSDVKVGGVHHLGLSVSDLKASEDFFVKQIGFRVFKRDEGYPAVFLENDDVVITLWQVSRPDTAIKFDRKNNVGLHHVAFSVESFDALNSIYEKLKRVKNVRIEFSPELLGGGPAKHMMMYEPSGNRIEFIHRPSKTDKE